MSDYNLKIGLNTWVESAVSQKNTAKEFGSGSLDVYATPAMISLMEQAALSAVEPHLPAGYTTVGTMVNIVHVAATPIGMKVRAYAELTEADGRKLYFKVEAYDEEEKVGEGIHERFIVSIEKFRNKVYVKK